MVPMHSKKRKGAFHEPDRSGIRSLHWESGAEDARTPDASRLPASPNRAKRLECVRFIGAFRLHGTIPRFMIPMHSEKRKRALYEPQGAAGILPAEASEQSPADETSAAPYGRHRPACSRFMTPMD